MARARSELEGITRRAPDVFDHPGLFMVPIALPRTISPSTKTPKPRPGGRACADRSKGERASPELRKLRARDGARRLGSRPSAGQHPRTVQRQR